MGEGTQVSDEAPPIPAEIPIDWTDGLLPVIVQDASSGEVLTMAWMNRDAYARTRAAGEMWFWSRSRQALWHKGEISGNTQRLVELRLDCDGDALLAQVIPQGPACHTGQRSCFHRTPEGEPRLTGGSVLARLEARICERRQAMPDGSYTAHLFRAGITTVGAKVREEAEEVVRAAERESDDRVAEEAADVLYHLMVLLAARGIPLERVIEVLAARGA
ncbi:MAG: bifunctional phosphoribosyl-AMP cyclohydrolase/phosphoribosyl-ATP diphosphatase HisIE [Armatimonadetes bacterium]|nr:bifunctional phosphoribosyl-AMP cyclohydrolase/phosphoribosyl-ATP diphosphatase HisIE [Armatimonadota bacterium]